MKKICIIGSGSWGCALAIHLGNLGHEVKIWSFDEGERDFINEKRTCKFLPGSVIPKNVTCTLDYKEAIQDSDMILHITPSKFTRDTVRKYKEYVTNQPIIICSKGFESSTLMTLDDVIKEELPNSKIAVLSGPSHAEEVSIAIPTALVVASEDKEVCKLVQNEFMNDKLRIYTCDDVKGVELGGALKNIIAFCAGIAAGLELGDNSFAALITRGLKEITELGVALGGNKETFYGLTGLGDLIVTCQSEHSRNRRAGMLIGKGKTLEEAKREIGMVIEGVDNIEVAHELGKRHNIEMPILNTVYAVLFENLKPEVAVRDLMIRNKKSEF